MVNDFNSERSKEARELILNDLRIVVHAFDKFLSISDANKNLELSVKNYKTFEGIFSSVKRNLQYIDTRDVNNISEWQAAVNHVIRIEMLFTQYNGFINQYFYIRKIDLNLILKELNPLINRLEKTSTIDVHNDFFTAPIIEPTVTRENTPLKELVKLDIQTHDMFIEHDLEKIDFSKYNDYILFSFTADKDEINLSTLNQAFGEYLLELGDDEISEIQSFDLESMIVDLDKEEDFEGEYKFSAVIVNDLDEGITVTSKENSEIYFEFSTINHFESNQALGEFFYENSELIDYPFVHIEPTSAPAHMAGLILLNEVVSEADIREHFGFYVVSGSIVGMKYKDQIYRFNLGDVDEIDNGDSYLVTIDVFRTLKGF